MPTTLSADHVARDLAVRDLTDPAEGHHAIQLLIDDAVSALATAWDCEVRVARGPRIVSLAHNYDDLGFAADVVTRDARYTRYVGSGLMLRSHSSAMVPPALRQLASEPSPPRDVLLVCPGITYRRDAIDRLHTGTPHQLDLWRITSAPVGDADMVQMVSALAGALVPGLRWRAEPRVHPYTLEGRQVDVDSGHVGDSGGGEWVEILECGLAHPDVLARCGLAGWHGLALGMGLDRLLMLRKGVPDIRLLRATDPRVVGQMDDLSPYRSVSSLPPVTRDISVAVAVDDLVEDIGDRVRDALGDDADVVESVTVVSQTPYDELPPAARERLGLERGHKNVLVRMTLRPVDRTLTDDEANVLRDRIYAAVHRGTTHQWAATRASSALRPISTS